MFDLSSSRAFLVPILATLLLVSPCRAQEDASEPVEPGLRLLHDIEGRRFNLRRLPGLEAVVLAWTSEGCPMSKVYSPRLVEIAKSYAEKGVRFFVIDSSPQDSADFLRAWGKQHDCDLPLIRDEGGRLARGLGVSRTTEVLVFDAALELRYRGAIDDQYGFERSEDPKTGKVGSYRKEGPSRNYLRDALDVVLSGREIAIANTEPWGCAIGSWPDEAPAPAEAPTWYRDVRPILERHCTECHHRGGNAPFSLQSHRKAAGWGDTIIEVIESGAMPPWNANPDHGRFSNARGLSSKEKATLAAWVAAGHPEGDEGGAEPARIYRDEWTIGQPDLVLEVPEFEVPAEGLLPYQYYRVETVFEKDTWLGAAEVRSTNPEVVHHVLMFLDGPRRRPEGAYTPYRPVTRWADLVQGAGEGEDRFFFSQARRAQMATNREGSAETRAMAESLGYRQRMRTSRQNGLLGYFLSSLPGSNSRVFPAGQGKFIPAGSRIVFQFHFTPNGRAMKTKTRLGLRFLAERPAEVVSTHSLATLALRIPPGEANYVRRVEFVIPREAKLLSFHPHMHYRGKSFRYELERLDGTTEILLDVPHYDFDWQHEYRLAEPLVLQPGSKLIGTAVFDNSDRNPYNPDPTEEVLFGLQSFEEMYVGYFSVVWKEEPREPSTR